MLTVSEMVKRNQKAGYNWFDRETMIFWGSVIEAPPNKNNIFITSEWESFEKTTRAYTLRYFDEKTNQIETIGEFLQYPTMKEAREGRKKVGD